MAGEWWFASTYFVLFLIHPYLNLLLHAMDKGAYQRYLLLLIPYSVAVVCVVYVDCTLIDLLRQATVERVYMGVVSRNSEKISSGLQKMLTCTQRVLFGGCL